MRTAFEIAVAQADLREPRPHRLDMPGLAVMRGAGERDMLVAEAKFLDRAAFDEGHRLDRLVGRAWQDAGVDVAPRGDDGAVRFHHGGGAFVPALDHGTAGDFDDDRTFAHDPLSNKTTVTLS